MRARFYCIDDSPGTRPIVLDSYPVFLGVGGDGRLEVSESASGFRRCQVQLEEGTLVAIDLNSPEGTWVNGESIERAPLMPGDKLHIGGHSLVVSYERLTRQPPPDPLYRTLVPEPAVEEVAP
jgi:hypothetical protein